MPCPGVPAPHCLQGWGLRLCMGGPSWGRGGLHGSGLCQGGSEHPLASACVGRCRCWTLPGSVPVRGQSPLWGCRRSQRGVLVAPKPGGLLQHQRGGCRGGGRWSRHRVPFPVGSRDQLATRCPPYVGTGGGCCVPTGFPGQGVRPALPSLGFCSPSRFCGCKSRLP